jgi:26S proteasome regulatory subunit N1
MGKGTIGINPFYHDGTIMSHGAMAGLLSVIISFTDAKSCEYLFIDSSLEVQLYWGLRAYTGHSASVSHHYMNSMLTI